MITIAIDGPSGAGKSTVARAVAKKLGYLYVDTGALYRAIGLFMLQNHIALDDAQAVEKALPQMTLSLSFEHACQQVILCKENVTQQIRTSEVSMAASAVSAIPAVRKYLLDLQRDMAKTHHIVMDGRDIGTVIFPQAQVKIFLTASVQARAKRRFAELQARGEEQTSYARVLEEIQKRDQNDSSRAQAPLKQAQDAILVDSSNLTLKQTIKEVDRLIKKNRKSDLDFQSLGFYNFGKAVCSALLRLYFHIEVRGIENLPPIESGFIFCCNHQSYLDPVMGGLPLKHRYLVFMAKKELFDIPIFGSIIRRLGAFPVARGKDSAKAIQLAVNRIRQGRILALYPEGTRSKNGKLLRPKSGAMVIAAQTGADIVPAAIKYYGKHPRAKVIVSYGKPISNAQLGIEEKQPKQIKEATLLMWKKVSELYESE